MIDINKNKEKFTDMYENYKTRILSVSYPEKELKKITQEMRIKHPNLKESEIIKAQRIKLLSQKYDHSLRVYKMTENLNETMNNNEEFKNLSNIAGLLHDYGRFIQAVLFNNYSEAETFFIENGLTGHGQIGARILFNLDEIKNFDIDKKYYEILKKVIENHSLPTLGIYAKKIDSKFKNQDIFNDTELTISCMLQMVKDADMCDILYQRIIGEYPIFSKTFNIHVNGMTLQEISKITGVEIDTIIKWNNLQAEDISKLAVLKLPFEEVDSTLLEVPEKIKKSFYSKSYIYNPKEWDLQKMKNDKSYNYNSIIAMWWTIGQFLGNMNFKATLKLIKDNQILEQIYEKYPKKYQYLVKDMFEFAIEELLKNRLKNNKIYAKTLI